MDNNQNNTYVQTIQPEYQPQPNSQIPAGANPMMFQAPQGNGQQYTPNIKPQKPKRNFIGLGIFLGMVMGVLFSVFGFVLVVGAYRITTGKPLTLGKKQTYAVSDNFIDEATAAKLQEVQYYLETYYYEDLDYDAIREGIIKGALSGVGDPYSVYYTAEEYEELLADDEKIYGGIGALLSQDATTKVVTINNVYKNTPAAAAGLMKGDVIQYVGDIDATSMDLNLLVLDIRGEEGTDVDLTIYRPSTGETLEITVTRAIVQATTVENQMLTDEVGYIQITEFANHTAEEFKAAYEELEAQGMTKLVVDVRDNPGGLVDSVVEIADYLLPEGVVVYTKDKNGYESNYYSDSSCKNVELVLLVNGGSASASEILTGAIKDYQYGTIVGTQTFGKGICQYVLPLEDGDGMKTTYASYYSPNGINIHGVGIKPDIELEYQFLGGENDQYSVELDNQIQKALELLQ